MLTHGIPETIDEARDVVDTAAHTDYVEPPHYPHAQIVALAQTVIDLAARVDALEAKPRRGRPPKSALPALEVV